MYARSPNGYYFLPTDKELLRDDKIYSESFEELLTSHNRQEKKQSEEQVGGEREKLKTITLDYTEGDTKLDQLPFDPFLACKIRLLNFANGAIYAVKNKHLKNPNPKEIAKIDALVKKKLEDLGAIQKYYKNHPEKKPPLKVLSVELNRFYAEDLPNEAGLTLQEIGLGEALYTWQAIQRPTRITRHRETISDSKEQEEHKDYEEKEEKHLIIEQIEEPFSPPLTLSQKRELIKVHNPRTQPDWFTDLPEWARHLLKNGIIPESVEGDWHHYEKSHPTVLRRIPGTHTTRHRLVIKDQDGNVLLETLAIRQGALTSFGMKNPAERQHSATENLRQVLSDQCSEEKLENEFEKVWGIAPKELDIIPNQLIIAEKSATADGKSLNVSLPILLCSLLTPRDQSNFVGRCIDTMGLSVTDSGDTGGTVLIREKNQACNQCDPSKKYITSLNFAVNAQRKVKKTRETNFIVTAKNFLEKLSRHVTQLDDSPDKTAKQRRLQLLDFAIQQLELINSDEFEQNKNRVHHINKNIYRAALHDIIVRLIVGLPVISCKSSKDRSGCEFIIADAILIDWSKQLAQGQKLCFSAFDKEKRPAFIQLVCRLYASGHQLFNAHDNSPGAPGIKDEGVLSQDIRKQLGEIYKTSKKLAEFNKPRSFWQKHRNKIWRWSMGGVAFLLGVISLILFCTGKLSPLGIVVAKGANVALNAAGCSFSSAVLTAACCKIKEIRDRCKSAAYTFVAELARIKEKSVPAKLSRSTHADLQSIGGTASYYNKSHFMITPVGVASFAWRQCQRQSHYNEKKDVSVNRLSP